MTEGKVMNTQGKTLTILLIVISILLLSLTGISLFFFQKETELRKSLENKLASAKAAEAKLDSDLKEAKKQIFLLEEKDKESDEKIEGLLDELELEKGLREEIKSENTALKDALSGESQTKEKLQADLQAAQDQMTTLEEKLKAEEAKRTELETKLKDMEGADASQVELEKIVVNPGEIPAGKILSVNNENNFATINLGQDVGLAADTVLAVYRGEKYLGDIKVTRVEAAASVADFIPPFSSKQVKKNDKVMTKKQ